MITQIIPKLDSNNSLMGAWKSGIQVNNQLEPLKLSGKIVT
jgi:hypothetical protein